MNKDKQLLSKYLPEKVVDNVYASIVEKNILLRISKTRRTKLGDYRPAMNSKPHRISINHDLNPFDFLITFVHELAHLYAFEKYGRKHQPHGIEWKKVYQQLMQPYLEADVFPEDVKNHVIGYLYHSNAANGSDIHLKRILQSYDKKVIVSAISIEKLPEKSHFKLPDGRIFQKLELRRKRFKCLCLNNNRLYLFSPIALVESIEPFDPNQYVHLLKKMG